MEKKPYVSAPIMQNQQIVTMPVMPAAPAPLAPVAPVSQPMPVQPMMMPEAPACPTCMPQYSYGYDQSCCYPMPMMNPCCGPIFDPSCGPPPMDPCCMPMAPFPSYGFPY